MFVEAVYTAKITKQIQDHYDAACLAGEFHNIELTNNVFSVPFLMHRDFYMVCFNVAKKVLKHPYVLSSERTALGSRVLIQFVQQCDVTDTA